MLEIRRLASHCGRIQALAGIELSASSTRIAGDNSLYPYKISGYYETCCEGNQ